MQELIIRDLFKNFLPTPTEAELEQLEANLVADGRANDPLIVWRGHLVDGFSRYEICTRLGLEYDTLALDLPSEQAVLTWMIDHQTGRRNWSAAQAAYTRGKMHQMEVRRRQQRDRAAKRKGEKTPEHGGTAAELVAEKTGVSEPTVHRDVELTKAVDKLALPLKTAYLSGGLDDVSRAEILVLSTKPKEEQQEFARRVRTGESKYRDLLEFRPDHLDEDESGSCERDATGDTGSCERVARATGDGKREEAEKVFGKLVRLLADLRLYDRLQQPLDAISRALKG